MTDKKRYYICEDTSANDYSVIDRYFNEEINRFYTYEEARECRDYWNKREEYWNK